MWLPVTPDIKMWLWHITPPKFHVNKNAYRSKIFLPYSTSTNVWLLCFFLNGRKMNPIHEIACKLLLFSGWGHLFCAKGYKSIAQWPEMDSSVRISHQFCWYCDKLHTFLTGYSWFHFYATPFSARHTQNSLTTVHLTENILEHYDHSWKAPYDHHFRSCHTFSFITVPWNSCWTQRMHLDATIVHSGSQRCVGRRADTKRTWGRKDLVIIF